MPLKRPQFVNGEYYHIFNRGVEKRDVFLEVSDYFRFISCLYELNDKNSVVMRNRIENRKKRKKCIGATYAFFTRQPLVEIIVFCLMPNHYHLIVRQLVDGGISLFIKKLANSYVGYFNEKYNRKGMGSLFQGRFKAVHIDKDEQFAHLVRYIFTNPLELLEKNWKEEGVKNPQDAKKFLESYKWSSYLDCIGISNFPSVTQALKGSEGLRRDRVSSPTERRFIIEFFGSSDKIKEFVEDWILGKSEFRESFERIKNIILE